MIKGRTSKCFCSFSWKTAGVRDDWITNIGAVISPSICYYLYCQRGWCSQLEILPQNACGWMGPPYHITQLLLTAQSAGAGFPWPCPAWFWIFPGMYIVQVTWATCSSVWPPLLWKSIFLCLNNIPTISVCAHCILSCPLNWKQSCSFFLPIKYTYKCRKRNKQYLSLLFSWLNNALSFILSSYVRYSKPLLIFMALCWACLSKPFSFFSQGAQRLTQHCGCVSSVLGREKGSLLLTFRLCR